MSLSCLDLKNCRRTCCEDLHRSTCHSRPPKSTWTQASRTGLALPRSINWLDRSSRDGRSTEEKKFVRTRTTSRRRNETEWFAWSTNDRNNWKGKIGEERAWSLSSPRRAAQLLNQSAAACSCSCTELPASFLVSRGVGLPDKPRQTYARTASTASGCSDDMGDAS
jgi:hypothetical protein